MESWPAVERSPHYVTIPKFVAQANGGEWSLAAFAFGFSMMTVLLALTHVFRFGQRSTGVYFALLACVNFVAMVFPSCTRPFQLFILTLGSHAVRGVLDGAVKEFPFASERLVSTSVCGWRISLDALIFLVYQTGIVRAASLVARFVFDQESLDCKLLLLTVNFSCTVLGMAALNLLRVRLNSLRLAACQVVMFLFTMQYSAFELAPTLPFLRIPHLSFMSHCDFLLFVCRAVTSFELLVVAMWSSVVLWRRHAVCGANVCEKSFPIPA